MRIPFSGFLKVVTERSLGILSLVVAVVSLLFSGYSVVIANRAQTYTENRENMRRSIVLVGDTGAQKDELNLKPLQSEMRLLSGFVYFPKNFLEEPAPIGSGGEVRWMGSVINGIRKHVSESIPVYEGHVSIAESGIPVVIYSYYAFEGQVYEDWSLYNFTFLSQVGSVGDGGTKVTLNGLIYGDRINSISEDGAKTLPEELWLSMKNQNFGLPAASK